MNYSEILQNERKKQGLSMYALAKKANVNQSAIKDWETGRRHMNLSSADRVFKALGITVSIGKENN